MRRWDLIRYVLTSCAVAALLAGCESQSPGAIPQTRANGSARSAGRRDSASYQQLFRFHPPKDGTHPEAGLTEVRGTLYGTTEAGGLSDKGTVYSISTSGVWKLLHRFRGGTDGANPQSGLLNVNGTLYGTTAGGGPAYCNYSFPKNCGAVFSITPGGKEKVVYAFKGGSDGAHPLASLIDENGTFYGTTMGGGAYHLGTVFSVSTSGAENILHSFAGGSDGANPLAGLINVKGVLYGTTANGGKGGGGTVFRVTPAGVEKVLYAFQSPSGGLHPSSGLTDVNGMLYGTTFDGGDCHGCGVVYRISTKGAEKLLYQFKGGSDGEAPQAVIELNGVLYGTTANGGSSCFGGGDCGTVFSITTAGVETVLYVFAAGTDGAMPYAPLTNVNGTLYGTTYHGGNHDVCCVAYGYGTVFALTP
jgi:uncharacterized repeat protein (TIGR03803 family)